MEVQHFVETYVNPWLDMSRPVFTYSSFLGFSHPVPLIVSLGSSIFYLLLILVIAPLFKPRSSAAKSFMEKLRYVHNIFLFLFSFVVCASVFVYMLVSGEFWSLDAVLCTTPPKWMLFINLLFTVSKVYEWGDTLFLVWLSPRGANSFLHIYHHATTFWLFLLVSDLPGPLRMGLLLNGFVHTLMYAHYAWPFPHKLVPFITIAQIIQLGIVTYLWSITPLVCANYEFFPKDLTAEFWTPYAMVPVYLLFFVHFFVKRFITGGRKKRTGDELASLAKGKKE